MATQVTATYIDGVLRPDELVSLRDHARVNLTITPLDAAPDPGQAWESLKQRLSKRPIIGKGGRVTRDELHERG